jgi:hypothetical protein
MTRFLSQKLIILLYQHRRRVLTANGRRNHTPADWLDFASSQLILQAVINKIYELVVLPPAFETQCAEPAKCWAHGSARVCFYPDWHKIWREMFQTADSAARRGMCSDRGEHFAGRATPAKGQITVLHVMYQACTYSTGTSVPTYGSTVSTHVPTTLTIDQQLDTTTTTGRMCRTT